MKRHQSDKVLRYSIRKYSFGAASVAVAALMFLGTRVVSADSLVENTSHSTAGVVNPENKVEPPVGVTEPTENKVEVAQNPLEKEMPTNSENIVKVVDKAKLRKVVEELNTTLSSKSDLDNSVLSPIKDRVQKGQALLDSDTAAQKYLDELLSLLESDLTALSNAAKESSKVQENAAENNTEIKDNKTTSELSEADKTISDKKESLKLSAEQLQAAVLELPEHESTKEVLGKANEVLSLAQGLLTNTGVTSNELEDLNNRVKRTFNSVKIATLRLTSGKNDPRNGKKIEKGTNVRAASISSTWDSSDNLLIYQRFRASDGDRVVRNELREYTENKVDMFAKTTTIGGERYVVYDVFFNNDGTAMAHLSRYQIYRLILPPQILDLNSDGTYKGNTLRDLKFETYTRNGNSGTLSQNPERFTITGSYDVNFLRDSTDYGPYWKKLTYFYSLDIRHGNSYNQDMRDTFKGNSNDPLLIHAVTRTESKFNKYSYGFGVKTEDRTSAVHMQVKAKLKAGVTDDQVRNAYSLAVAGTFGETTNQAYTFVSGRDTNEPTYTGYDDQPVQPTLRDNQAPTVKMTNPTDGNKSTVLTDNESTSPVTRIYRGATLNVPLSMYDNDPRGKVNLKYEGGLPKGVNFNNGTTLSKTGAVEKTPGTTNVTGTVAADAPLGKHTATFKVSDDQSGNVDKGNKSTVKFRTEVVDLEFEDGKGEIRQDGTLVVKGNKGTSLNDANNYLRTTDGTTHNDSFFPGGMKFKFIQPDNTVKNNVTFNTPGKHVVKAAAYFPENYAGTNGIQTVPRTGVQGDNVSEITNRAYLTKNIEVQIKPTAPTVTPETNGDVTVTPVAEENVNTFNFTYKDPNNSPKTVTATKINDGWTLSNAPADGVTIDKTTGKVTIKDRAIKDSDSITAKSKTNDNVESDPVTKTSNVGDKIPPVFTFAPNGKEKIVDATGKQVVYVTPTEDTNLNIGAVTDNSNKLVEAIFKETNGNASGLGFPGLTHNGVLRVNNVEVAAPRDIIVTGKVSEYKTGTTRWVDDEVYTRNVNATDASNNSISNTREHPTAVTFKVLTQATKYDPQFTTQAINKDVTASDAKVTQAEFDAIKSNITFTSQRGEVKISNSPNNRTAGLNITMNDNGKIKRMLRMVHTM